MQDRPSPVRPVRPALRLATGLVIAVIGAMLVASGILAIARNGAPSASATAVAEATDQAPAASVLPTGPASESPPSESPPSGSAAAPSPSSTADLVLVGAGDIGVCGSNDDEATASLVERIPGIVFTLGDNAYDTGSASDFQNCFGSSWGAFKDRIQLPVAGNHDWETDNAQGYRDYFGAVGTPDGVTWYSHDIGAWHVIVLDADCAAVKGCGPDSPQGKWLAADLARDTARCTLALWHQPRFSSGFHGDDATVAPFWEALYAAGADLVLNGHDHDYERFAPQDPSGDADPAKGITEIVAGTGGAGLRDFGRIVPNGIVRSSFVHGVLVLTLHQTGWDSRFVSTDGSFADQAHGTCH